MNKRQKKKLVKMYLDELFALKAAYEYFSTRHPPVIKGNPLGLYMVIRTSLLNNEYQKKMYGKVKYPSIQRVVSRNMRQYYFNQISVDATALKISKPSKPTKKEIAIELLYLERLVLATKPLV